MYDRGTTTFMTGGLVFLLSASGKLGLVYLQLSNGERGM